MGAARLDDRYHAYVAFQGSLLRHSLSIDDVAAMVIVTRHLILDRENEVFVTRPLHMEILDLHRSELLLSRLSRLVLLLCIVRR